MRSLTRRLVSVAGAALLLGLTIVAQDDPTRRLSVNVIGFEMNEAAAHQALAAGADINWKNPAMDGETMLITAIKGYKEPKVIKFLLENGANPAIRDDTGRTALDWAIQRNIGRDRNGRETIELLQAASGKGTKQDVTGPASKNATPKAPATSGGAERKPASTAGKAGPPTPPAVKAAIERKFTNEYIDHFFGVENKVTFEWVGGITVGAIQRVRAAPKPCYPVRLQVSITAEDPRDGNQSTVVRGMNSTTGGYREEIFCFYRDGFGEWDFGAYGK